MNGFPAPGRRRVSRKHAACWREVHLPPSPSGRGGLGGEVMDVDRLRSLLEHVKSGEMAVEGALTALRSLPFEDLGFAKLDHHRALRNGFPEVIYCPGKTTEHIVAIARALRAPLPQGARVGAAAEVAEAVLRVFPHASIRIAESDHPACPNPIPLCV